MIDPFHMYLARRPSLRASETKSKAATQSESNSASKSSSVDSKSQQSSYNGGESLSPASTTSTDHITKTSLAGSSGSSTSAVSLQHRLPEFEHFRQSSPLMPEFYPRTSEFFSQGRRRSSIAVPTDASTTASGPPPTAAASKKPDTFHLPLTFDESDSLVGEQLPVRLGLAPPSHSHGLPASEITYKARVGHGHYFYTPPPVRRGSTSSKSSTRVQMQRRNTDTAESPVSAQAKPTLSSVGLLSSSPVSTLSSGIASAHRGRASSSVDATTASSGSNPGVTSPRPRLPPNSSECWHPDAYFSVSRARVKGKMREYVHHAFPTSVVPYWHGYNAETIEAEMSTHLNVQAALHGNTLRDFPEGSRPCRVLDLGCGRGVWCLEMAREWKASEFVGLDIVPIQPPLHQLGDADLEHRVSWVVANFLEPLPFPDASFDYIHIRFILQGVPEDKWVDIFSEARRILAPGGVLEVVEGNYSFFGHASLVDVNELKDLEHGRTASKKGVGVKLPRRLKVLNDASDSADVDAIEIVLERMMHRRFINPTPLSVVPSALLLPGFSNVANGNPRHIPVYAESKAQRARARQARDGASSSNNATSSEDEGKRQGKFTSRGQIGKPLNSQFAMTDADLFCALVILQQLDHISSSRELIWAEAEDEKRSLHGVAQPELTRMDASRRFGHGNPAALKPFAHPWKSKDQFYRAMDAWIDSVRASADTENMLHKYLGWEQAHEDLTVEGRKYAERRRKMSVTPAAIPSLGLESLRADAAVEAAAAAHDDQERKEALEAMHEMDKALGADGSGAFAVATTHAHEAPARLQTHDDDDGASTIVDKKKKRSKRPSSSGGVGSGAAAGVSTGRARAFGRGGVGGGAPLPVPLPDAPAFMAGYAFAPPATDPATMFRGPATKARVTGRKGSSAKSHSDRSSMSGKTEKEDAKPRALEPGAVQPAPAISPAAEYAAKQRVSHGLEHEYHMHPSEADRAPSRPVSPTSRLAPEPAPAPVQTGLGSHPPAAAAAHAVPDRSVSMPATLAHMVRIAEPPRPMPRQSRSSSRSTATAVAMIGFYDCTGFLATA